MNHNRRDHLAATQNKRDSDKRLHRRNMMATLPIVPASAEPDSKKETHRRKRGATDLHIVSLPLKIRESDRHMLDKRLRAACALYNALLQEGRTRVEAMRDDPAWRAACKTPKGPARTALFKWLRTTYRLMPEDLGHFEVAWTRWF